MTFRNFISYVFGGGWQLYSKRYSAQVEIVSGRYAGRVWKIVSCNGVYPLVYISGDEDVYDREDGPAHGGITFVGSRYDLGMPKAIGYDYCHADDYLMLRGNIDRGLGEGRLHSLPEIKRNIRKTIDWLNGLEGGGRGRGGDD